MPWNGGNDDGRYDPALAVAQRTRPRDGRGTTQEGNADIDPVSAREHPRSHGDAHE